MKKVFMPSMDDLSLMEEYGVDIYKYITVKVIEMICACNVNNGIKFSKVYKYLRDDYYIAKGVCSVFPSQIEYSDMMRYDVSLCRSLLQKSRDNSIYNLDELSSFDSNTLKNDYVINDVINILANNLKNNPEYRFIYKDSTLLNDIFSTKLTEYYHDTDNLNNLVSIEPYYALLLGREYDRKRLLLNGMDNYANRYNINGYINRNDDNLDSPKVKRLINFIDRNKKNLY